MAWISEKSIDTKLFQKHLQLSTKRNHFANNGPAVIALESWIRTHLQINPAKSVIVTANATIALHLIFSALKSKRICTQSFTFPSSAQYVPARTKIVDIDHEGGPDLTKVSLDTDTLVVTNLFGNVVDLKKYTKWQNEQNAFLVLDNANTPFSFYNKSNSLNYGTAAVVSFHHTKPLGFGEGGCIIIDNIWEQDIRKMINFGYDVIKGDQKWLPAGCNGKMSDVSAAAILQHLEHFPKMVHFHKENLQAFKNILPSEFKLLPNFSENPFMGTVAILFPRKTSLFDLKHWPMTLKKYYKPLVKSKVAADWWDRIICFPCHSGIQTSEIFQLQKYFESFLE